ncbi:four helix bundle protein [Fulvivirgaceae bacterium PWU4]|uniref:Four helix bundle protein n=1 Tax=Chryseosolibacter histidini TaxID=2782349 RepID=A0AAP2GL18_9BACT|nr:four helix bundle protein [Chryseosolibacter histidini]MBT1699921.1 four helix bundle protein [Chryseosolibacter histidini]
MAFKFEKLKVWEMSVDLSGEVSDLVKLFPKDELYVLTAQIKRASDSISLNIAEGSTGQSNPEFKKFLGYSLRSAIEVVGCLFLARRRRLIPNEQFDFFYNKLTILIKSIQALRNTLK